MTRSDPSPGASPPSTAEAELDVGVCSEAGPRRPLNEDACLALAPAEEGFCAHLFAVAGGLGGPGAGDVAARLALDTLHAEAARTTLERPESWLREALSAANRTVHDHARTGARGRGMQSTATVLLLAGDRAYVGHAGDCRAYLVRDHGIEQCTTDHTRAVEMMRLRLITPEAARTHPARGQLTRSLGARPALSIDVLRRPLRPGDGWVLCSDGLWSELTRDEIAAAVRRHPAPEAARRLVTAACDRGARDNASAVVVRVERPGTPLPLRSRRWPSPR